MAAPHRIGTCCSFFLSHILIFSFLPILTAPSSTPSILSSFAHTPTRAKLPSWIFSWHSSTPSFFLVLQLWAENNGPEDFLSVTHQVTLGTHVCPRVHTQWIFSFYEAINPTNLAPFPLFYTEENKHIKIRRLFLKSHSHKSKLETWSLY